MNIFKSGDRNINMAIEMITYCFASGRLYDMKRYGIVVCKFSPFYRRVFLHWLFYCFTVFLTHKIIRQKYCNWLKK